MTSRTTAADEWMSAVTTPPASAAPKKPSAVFASKNESASRISGIPRSGAKPFFSSSRPKKSIPRPIADIAALRTFSRFEKR